MKEATYTLLNGDKVTVEYDENAPCKMCGLPVIEASMGGTNLCPWCDCGNYRNGEKFTLDELLHNQLLRRKAKKINDSLMVIIQREKDHED